MTREELADILRPYTNRDNPYFAVAVLAALEREREGEVVLYSGLCKVGEPDFQVKSGRGDNESVVLVPVPYKLIKGKRVEIIARPTKAEKGGE